MRLALSRMSRRRSPLQQKPQRASSLAFSQSCSASAGEPAAAFDGELRRGVVEIDRGSRHDDGRAAARAPAR